MSESPHINFNDPAERGHETSDANFKTVLVTGIALLGIMVLGLLLSWGVYAFFKERTAAPGFHAETMTTIDVRKLPPGPNLQTDPHAELVALRRAEDSVLFSYGWVNKDSGIVRIPIERAMELLVKKGVAYRREGRMK